MRKKVVIFFVFIFLAVFSFAQEVEEIRIVTYYPAPYGSYTELAASRMKIGPTFSQSGTSVGNGNLIVENNVAIGTATPISGVAGSDKILTIAGTNPTIRFNDLDVGENDMEIHVQNGEMGFYNLSTLIMMLKNNNLGIGTSNPTERLHVAGNILTTGDIDIRGSDINYGANSELRLFANSPSGTNRRLYICGYDSSSSSVKCANMWVNGSGEFHLNGSTNDAFNINAQGGPLLLYSGTGSQMIFHSTNYYQWRNGNTNAEIMRLDASSGNLGVGDTTPTEAKIVARGGTVAGEGAYNNLSSHSSLKDRFKDINVLDKISSLRIKEWQYKDDTAERINDYARHLYPFADDFYKMFSIGKDDRSINALDVAGVALKGVQELNKKVEDLVVENKLLKEKISQLESN